MIGIFRATKDFSAAYLFPVGVITAQYFWFSDVFRGYKKRTPGINELKLKLTLLKLKFIAIPKCKFKIIELDPRPALKQSYLLVLNFGDNAFSKSTERCHDTILATSKLHIRML